MPLSLFRKIVHKEGNSSNGSNKASSNITKKAEHQRHLEATMAYQRSLQDSLLGARDQFEEKFEKQYVPKGDIKEYKRLRALGSGAFGTVFLLKKIDSEEYFAMKVMSRKKIVQTSQVEHIFNEKRILCAIDFPFLINMKFFYTDNSYLYFVLPCVNGGEMFTHLRREVKYCEEQARFYAAQVVLALEYLHFMSVAYRDLKPENILFDADGYIKITDMGFCKRVRGTTWTLCGTPEYMAPEILMNRGYNRSVDWWALGILIYEMCAGYTPFTADTHWKTYERILETRLKFPASFREKCDLVDLLKKLIQKDLTQRHGNLRNGVIDIKGHRWFMKIDWRLIYEKKLPAPYEPKKSLKDSGDMRMFEFTPEPEMRISEEVEYEEEFRNL